MRCLSLIVALALSGCATTGPRPVDVQIQERIVEVQRPCPVVAPARPAPVVRPLPDNARDLSRLLAAKLLEWSGAGGYADQADAAITICTRPN